MDKTVFDSAAFVSIDMTSGRISTPGRDELALIPNAILALVPIGDALNRAANGWGENHGRVLAERLTVDDVGVEALSSHLGGTLAALGMGRVLVEIRHHALVFRLTGGPHDDIAETNAAILGGFLTGYLGAVSGHPFAVLDLGLHGRDRLFWAGNPDAVDQARRAIENGDAPLAVIDALTRGDALC